MCLNGFVSAALTAMIAVQLPEDGSVIQDALYAGISFRVLFLNLMFYCIEKGGLKWGGEGIFFIVIILKELLKQKKK